ncbi:hypothetical protein AVT98_gp47 [Sulfolobales virus YNP1]|uniref:hypothetical protein n=1 Tax=Sulfolobales virus YNP1 TaxID=1732179 RepID=UPI000705E3FD|nr:hypothetical protein AVT98_gp47 [Sulfolobales virus YNP1]ALG97139.1 hypothetical protein [Sulfolobales virus YNP1]
MKELERREGENIDDYMERTLKLLVEVLSEIAVSESIVYPNDGGEHMVMLFSLSISTMEVNP